MTEEDKITAVDEANQRAFQAISNPPPYTPFPSFAEFARTGFDDTALGAFAAILERIKQTAGHDAMKAAVERATRWAAIDTGAIEGLYNVERGFTYTVAAGAAAWDNMHFEVGTQAQESINDALRAYEYVLDAATKAQIITEAWIRELHVVICNSQETYTVITEAGPQEHRLAKGTYKSMPNNPFRLDSLTVHAYAPVDDTAPEMQRFVEQLRSNAFAAAHPVLQAAYAHYSYVCIHPVRRWQRSSRTSSRLDLPLPLTWCAFSDLR